MLYIVPTPIGNLRDITLRALDVLKEADVIVCEDTREARKLLDHHQIRLPRLEAFHEHSSPGRTLQIVQQIEQGLKIALTSDGGMPLISDPGFQIVRECIKRGVPVTALPGPVAAVTALAAGGLATDSFMYYGFLPPKSASRRNALEKLGGREETLIFYESPHRLPQALADMAAVYGEREAVVARELTKKFEEYVRGKLPELAAKYAGKKVLGEIVVLVAGKNRKPLFG